MFETILQYLPTALVALILGLVAQFFLRKARKDDNTNQQVANRLKETQIVLDAQSNRIDQLNSDVERERLWRREAEDRERQLHNIVVGQIEVTAATVLEPPPKPTNRTE